MAGRSYGGESAEQRLARRRRQLLDAGLEVFGTTGYRSATVRQICRTAAITDRYFYEQFAQTEDLLLAVYAECLDRLTAAVAEAVGAADDDLDDLASVGLDAFLAVVESDARLARLVWFEVLGVSPRVEAAYLGRMGDFGQLILGLLEDRAGRTPRAGLDRDVVAQAAVGGISHTVMCWADADFATPRERLVAGLSTVLVGIADAASH